MIFKVGDKVRVMRSPFGLEGAEGEVVQGSDDAVRIGGHIGIGVEFSLEVAQAFPLTFHGCCSRGREGRCWYVDIESLEVVSPQLELFEREPNE